MQVEVGSVVEGKVTGITKFGAFVELSEGKTGMVHISEVASTYVNEISDHLTEGQMVKVKVIGITEEGKISLSIKKAEPRPERSERPDRPAGGQRQGGYQKRDGFQGQQGGGRPPRAPRRDITWQPKISEKPTTFEDMMSKFKQTSDDKMSDLKKYRGDVKKGSTNRKSRG